MDYQKEYEKWLNSPKLSVQEKKDLRELSEEEKKSRFFSLLQFGTAGLRGILGTGLYRMNIYTVRHATQALAQLVCREFGKSGSVAVAYDSRKMSKEFAYEACRVLAANGIKSYLFDELRPTPELSFAVRELGCSAGINITASHNPKEYNGYKVYWQDGAQIGPNQADVISDTMGRLDVFADVDVYKRQLFCCGQDPSCCALHGPGQGIGSSA